MFLKKSIPGPIASVLNLAEKNFAVHKSESWSHISSLLKSDKTITWTDFSNLTQELNQDSCIITIRYLYHRDTVLRTAF